MMNAKIRRPTLGLIVLTLILGACASPPPATPPASAPAAAPAPAAATPPASAPTAAPAPAAAPEAVAGNAEKAAPPGQTRYKWSMASEADVAAVLDKKFQDAAKHFVRLKRNDQVMFCKRYRDMGSNIPTLHCITEAELRKQVEDSDQVRDQMRQRMGKCDIAAGCGAGS